MRRVNLIALHVLARRGYALHSPKAWSTAHTERAAQTAASQRVIGFAAPWADRLVAGLLDMEPQLLDRAEVCKLTFHRRRGPRQAADREPRPGLLCAMSGVAMLPSPSRRRTIHHAAGAAEMGGKRASGAAEFHRRTLTEPDVNLRVRRVAACIRSWFCWPASSPPRLPWLSAAPSSRSGKTRP